VLIPERKFAPKVEVIWIEHHITWFCAYVVAMSLHPSLYHPTCSQIIMSSLMHTWNSLGAYTCNRCAENRVTSEVPRGVEPEVEVRSRAGGPVRRSRRRRGNRSWSRTLISLFFRLRQAPEHYKPPTFKAIIYLYMLYVLLHYVIEVGWKPLLHW
jgi:hypothetical protein